MVLEVVEHLLVQQQQNQGILSLRHLHRYHHHHSLKVKKTKNIFVQHTFVIIKTTFGIYAGYFIYSIFYILLKTPFDFAWHTLSKREKREQREKRKFSHLNILINF